MATTVPQTQQGQTVRRERKVQMDPLDPLERRGRREPLVLPERLERQEPRVLRGPKGQKEHKVPQGRRVRTLRSPQAAEE